MEENNLEECPKEYIEHLIDEYSFVEKAMDLEMKSISDKNNNLNWCTTIITALFIYSSSVLFNLENINNLFILLLLVIMYFIFIIKFNNYKLNAMDVERLVHKQRNYQKRQIQWLQDTRRLYELRKEEKYKSISDKIFNKLEKHKVLDEGYDLNDEMIIKATDKMSKSYRTCYRMFLFVILFLPSYIGFNLLVKLLSS